MTVALVPLSDSATNGQLKLNAGNWLAFVFVRAVTNGVAAVLPNLSKLFIVVKLAHWEKVDVNAVNNDVRVIGNVNVFRLIQLANAEVKVVKDAETVAGIVNVVNDQQLLKVLLKVVHALILVGIVTVVKDLQPEKHDRAVVTAFNVDGKVILWSDVHVVKALDKLFSKFMLVGIVIDSNLGHVMHIDVIVVILFWVLFGKTIVFRFWQLLNVKLKLVIIQPDGIVIEDSEMQLSKVDAKEIVDPTDVGKVTDDNLVQLVKQLAKVVKAGIGDCQITLVNEEQLWNAVCIDVALKFSGKVMVFKLKAFWNVFWNPYCAFDEQASGKYTFCKKGQFRNALDVSIAVPADAGDGNDVNLTHCNEEHVENVVFIVVTKLILGIVTFFKDVHPLKVEARDVQLFNVDGSDTVLRSTQLLNVPDKVVIAVAFDGISMSRKLVHPLNAFVKSVNPLADVGITTLYKLLQLKNMAVIWVVQKTEEGNFTYSNNSKLATDPVPPKEEKLVPAKAVVLHVLFPK